MSDSQIPEEIQKKIIENLLVVNVGMCDATRFSEDYREGRIDELADVFYYLALLFGEPDWAYEMFVKFDKELTDATARYKSEKDTN